MATTGNFPSSHTTTTTTTTTRVVIPPCRFDASYIKTIPGILKIAVIVLNFLGFICIMASGYFSTASRASWFNFLAVTGFWFSGVLLFMYLFHGIERLHMIPWLLLEFIYCLAWAIFYLIGASLCAAYAGQIEAWGAAAFFGFVAMIVYGYDAFLKFRGWRAGEIAQGERHTSSSTTTGATY